MNNFNMNGMNYLNMNIMNNKNMNNNNNGNINNFNIMKMNQMGNNNSNDINQNNININDNMNNIMDDNQFNSINNMNNMSNIPSIENKQKLKDVEVNNNKLNNFINQNINISNINNNNLMNNINNNNMNKNFKNNNDMNNNNIMKMNNINMSNDNNNMNNLKNNINKINMINNCNNIININNNNNMINNNNNMINNNINKIDNNINNNNVNMNNINFINNNNNMNNMNDINLNNQNNMLQINNNLNNSIQNFNMNNINNNIINQEFKQNINIESFKAVIQCLCNLENIKIFFLDKSNYNKLEEFKINFPITLSYAKIIKSFQNMNNIHQYIVNLKDIIDRSNKLISSNPKDIFIFIIENIHKELKVPFIPNINNFNDFTKNNIGKKFSLYKNFRDNIFDPENTSIISQNCFGGKGLKVQCNSCKMINYEYDIFKYIEFSINEIYSRQVEKAKVLIINNQNKEFYYLMNKLNLKKLNINDLFDYYINFCQQKNNYFCYKCNNCKDCIFYNKLIILPNILCLVLKRESNTNIKIDFEENFDTSNFINTSEFNIQAKSYELIGIISYLEENNTYFTMIKNKNDSQWYKYKDDNKSKISFQDARDNNGTPYILFYQNI